MRRSCLIFAAVLGTFRFPATAADFFPQHSTNSTVRVVEVDGTGLQSAFLASDQRVAAAFNLGLMTLTRAATIPGAWQSWKKPAARKSSACLSQMTI